jgi:hypothetical protein
MDEDGPFEISIPTVENPYETLLDLDNDVSPFSTTTSSPSLHPETTVPEQGTSTSACETDQRLPNIIDKTRAAGREVNDAPTPSSGTRARSRQVLRMMMGYPIRLQVHKGGVKGKRGEVDRLPPLSREERLLQRNAKKEALQQIPESDSMTEMISGESQVQEIEVGEETVHLQDLEERGGETISGCDECEPQVTEAEGGEREESSGVNLL